MALDFPDSPTDGQIFGGYTYNSAHGVWRAPDRGSLSGLSDVTNVVRKPGVSLQYYNSSWQSGYDYKILDIVRVFGTTSANNPQDFVFADYPGATALYIQAQAGGGGGGGAAATSASNAVGGAGGAGEYSELFIDLTDPEWVFNIGEPAGGGYSIGDRVLPTITMQAGRGGAAGLAGAAGGAGGDSYFWYDNKDVSANQDYWCGAEGGLAGAAGASLATNRYVIGAAGGNDPAGSGSGNNVNITSFSSPGSSGEAVMVLGATTVNLAHSGRGGMSVHSGGAASVVRSTAGTSTGTGASGYGGGGSGGVNTGTQSAVTGGTGSPGFVFVTVLG